MGLTTPETTARLQATLHAKAKRTPDLWANWRKANPVCARRDERTFGTLPSLKRAVSAPSVATQVRRSLSCANA